MDRGEPNAAASADREFELRERVRRAFAEKTPLCIVGANTKGFLGRAARGERFSVAGHRGISAYEPTELVVTARAGTPLEQIESELAAQGQMLAFEPPHFGVGATLGGTIACGLSGPRRPFAGSARDFVLGVKLLNGQGEILRFGGTVMKNVAGFDVSRLMVGAFGTLGVLLEVSLKVLPLPRHEETLCFDWAPDEALVAMQRWGSRPWPITALAYDERLRVRLSGDESAVRAARKQLGGEVAADPHEYWRELREHRLGFFRDVGDLWRLSVGFAARPARIDGCWLYDWGGAQRWLRTSVPPAEVFATAAACGGHATRFRSRQVSADGFQPLSAGLLKAHRALKKAFDPEGLLNSGRMYDGV